MMSFLLVLTRALALYGFAGWVYVALVALVHRETLSMQLTHLAPWPHEDTFGEASFAVSFVSYIAHHVLRHRVGQDDRRGRGVG